MEAQEYMAILAAHGRRVANRVAFSSLPKGEEREDGAWSEAFYCMYGPEDSLPEDERMRPGNPANNFDPTGWLALYRNHPADERSPMYRVTGGQSKWWFEQLVGAYDVFGPGIILLMYGDIVLGKESEACDHISDDQGEFVTKADGAYFCHWHTEWRGWGTWAKSMSEEDWSMLRCVLTWVCTPSSPFSHRWPNPGTPEAEAFIATLKEK
jgi:hypothetical protein